MPKIYTRKGDDGTTSLWYGGRISKADLRTEAYGALDEAVSQIGLARAVSSDEQVKADLISLQRSLFVAGAELATASASRDRLSPGESRVTDDMVRDLELAIDRYMEQVNLPPKFILPGGNVPSAALDVARAGLRRAERRVVDLDARDRIAEPVIRLLNRASDLLFAMARYSDTPNAEVFAGRQTQHQKRPRQDSNLRPSD